MSEAVRTGGNNPSAVRRTIQRLVECHPVAIGNLPPRAETFERCEVEISHALFQRLRQRRAIERVRFTDSAGRSRVGVYRVTEELELAAEAFASEGPWPDCPHTGIRNLGDGTYTCAADDCTARYDRATAEEVFGDA
jgi:hypothetical protein